MVNLYVSYINIGVIIGCVVCDGVGWVLSCDHCIILMFLHLNKDNRFEINCNLSTYHTVLRRSFVPPLAPPPPSTAVPSISGLLRSTPSMHSTFVRHISRLLEIWSNGFTSSAYGQSVRYFVGNKTTSSSPSPLPSPLPSPSTASTPTSSARLQHPRTIP